MKTNNIVVIYHANCSDGLTSASIAKYALERKHLNEDIEYLGGVYSEDPPEYKNKTIYFVDFCYKRDVIDQLIANGNTLVLIDHHKSAINGVVDLLDTGIIEDATSRDNTKSGTGLAWDYFFNGMPMPLPFQYIQDRDLWTWKLEESRPYLAAHNLIPKTLEDYYSFTVNVIEGDSLEARAAVIEQGHLVQVVMAQTHKETAKETIRYLSILGYDNLPTVNCPSFFMSDIGSDIIQEAPDTPFVLMWCLSQDGLKVGLRSKSDYSKVDVSSIATLIHSKGGGHHCAAGAFIPIADVPMNPVSKILLGF